MVGRKRLADERIEQSRKRFKECLATIEPNHSDEVQKQHRGRLKTSRTNTIQKDTIEGRREYSAIAKKTRSKRKKSRSSPKTTNTSDSKAPVQTLLTVFLAASNQPLKTPLNASRVTFTRFSSSSSEDLSRRLNLSSPRSPKQITEAKVAEIVRRSLTPASGKKTLVIFVSEKKRPKSLRERVPSSGRKQRRSQSLMPAQAAGE